MNSETNKKLSSDIKLDDSRTSATIETQGYRNSVKEWLNASNYPDGAFYKVVVSDDSLSYWEWKTNTDGLKSADTNVLLSNPDASSGTFKNQKNDIITFGFNKEGYRYGELTIYDKARNKVTYKIYANLDRTRPGCSSSYTSPNSYNGKWTNSDVELKGTCSDGISECEKSYISNTISYNINSYVSPGTVSDNAGNTYTCPTKLVRVDKCTETSSTTSWGSCSAECGSGIKKGTKTFKSTFGSGFTCKVDDVSEDCTGTNCSSIPKGTCNIRGNTIINTTTPWTCNVHHHKNTTAYSRYCTDGNGKIFKPTSGKWICPIAPYGAKDKWTVLDDSSGDLSGKNSSDVRVVEKP